MPRKLAIPRTLQTLSPAQARLCLSVQKFWQKEFIALCSERPTPVLLALSGGADSTAMACILSILARQLDLRLYAVTINHGLRPSATEDVAFVRDLCGALDIPCVSRCADVAGYVATHRCGIEDAGRRLRYAIFEEERTACNAAVVALGHTADDLCEDVLMRLARGTGWPALGGMASCDAARKIVRPLLLVPRQEIETFLVSLGVPWQTDDSNSSRQFTRNRFRLDIVPKFKAENPNFTTTIQRLWQLSRLDSAYWNGLLDTALAQYPWQLQTNKIVLGKQLLASLPFAALPRLLLRALQTLSHHSGTPARNETLLAICQAWQNKQGGKQFPLPKGIEVRLARGVISCEIRP